MLHSLFLFIVCSSHKNADSARAVIIFLCSSLAGGGGTEKESDILGQIIKLSEYQGKRYGMYSIGNGEQEKVLSK